MSLKRRFKKITDKPKNKKLFDANLHKIKFGDMSYVLIGASSSPETQ
jgi:hypothetical protein